MIISYHEFQDSIYIPAWSNGSPPDSKSGRLGSNPRAGAKSEAICIQTIDKPSLDGM